MRRPFVRQLDRQRPTWLVGAIASCHARFGRGSVVPARAGLAPLRRRWTTFEMRTPRYTNQLDE
ncbi:hypothetical protein ASF56_04295 [Methylobacterium sp. Leaf122]|nr:hypothetical protein ASF33_10165 [Methylobacterium sp. Leaf92]KQQ12393.1 hypothetical protein ASF56_04295 [Methylobacterium sp. Leaf122]